MVRGAPRRRARAAPRGSARAVFVDDGGGFWWSYGVAEALAAAGWQVVIVCPGAITNIPHESFGPLLARLGKGGVRFRILSVLGEVGPDAVEIWDVTSGTAEMIACNLVVLQTGRAVESAVGATLRATEENVHLIGDCIAPRRISHARLEAQRVARLL